VTVAAAEGVEAVEDAYEDDGECLKDEDGRLRVVCESSATAAVVVMVKVVNHVGGEFGVVWKLMYVVVGFGGDIGVVWRCLSFAGELADVWDMWMGG
jgi:hypothetical protein